MLLLEYSKSKTCRNKCRIFAALLVVTMLIVEYCRNKLVVQCINIFAWLTANKNARLKRDVLQLPKNIGAHAWGCKVISEHFA